MENVTERKMQWASLIKVKSEEREIWSWMTSGCNSFKMKANNVNSSKIDWFETGER